MSFWNSTPTPEQRPIERDFWVQDEGQPSEPWSYADRFWDNAEPPPPATEPLTGSVSVAGRYYSADSALSGYHVITGMEPGTLYVFTAARLEAALDPAMWLFANAHTYEDFLESGTLTNDQFISGTIDYLAYADDTVPANIPGPWSDPQATINAPESGIVTAVVTNFASGPEADGDGRFDYELIIEGGPYNLPGTSEPPMDRFWDAQVDDTPTPIEDGFWLFG